MKRSFASLDPQEALHIAIFVEARNADLYHRFAQMFTEFGDEESLETGTVFWEMAVEERGHHSLLRQKYAEQYGDTVCPLTEEDLVEFIEVPRLDDEVFSAGYPGEAARTRALKVALQAEIGAQDYYAKLVEQTPPGPLRQIFRDLAEMEDGHVAELTAKVADARAKTPSIH
jgi:rubrerythrin